MIVFAQIRTAVYSITAFGAGFFDFPSWDKYLPVTTEVKGEGVDAIVAGGDKYISNINDIWLIAAAIFEMILYGAGLLAIGYFIYSGFVIMTSQGNPDRVALGRKGLINAAVGLVVVILAANIVGLVVAVV